MLWEKIGLISYAPILFYSILRYKNNLEITWKRLHQEMQKNINFKMHSDYQINVISNMHFKKTLFRIILVNKKPKLCYEKIIRKEQEWYTTCALSFTETALSKCFYLKTFLWETRLYNGNRFTYARLVKRRHCSVA